ncbi:hypothetical protein Aple_073750 [Acrocarpospora pleiomorpha]|uniref:Uncharacterized protein n=1 Tax=Acrocarpospora pleiomorpha TaxID=90975 RepID=A0A5M3XUB7_9ACTN|nr:hypothetical protein Aple_073750 [Acrocarpospora pleiomorpha]
MDSGDSPTPPEALDFSAVLFALRRAYREAVKAVQATADAHEAYESATRLADGLREMADAAARVRAATAAQIQKAEKLSLAGLAERLGVSKARADQLLRAARKGSDGGVRQKDDTPSS